MLKKLKKAETIENTVGFFSHVQHTRKKDVAILWQRRLFEKAQCKEERGVHTSVVASGNGARRRAGDRWLFEWRKNYVARFAKLYWEKVGAEPAVNILRQLRKTYPDDKG